MKRVLALLFILSTGSIFAENVIIAVINNSAITFKSLENSLLNAISKEHKADIVHQRINDILQLQKAKELNIEASINDINLALLEISKSNNISLKQLQAYPEFSSLKDEVSEKISILNLQRYSTKDVTIDESEAIIFSKELEKIGCDYLCVSSGGNTPNPQIPIGPHYQVHLAKIIKQNTSMVIRTVGMITDPIKANEIIINEEADMVAMARAFLTNPRWVWDAAKTLKINIDVPPQYARRF